MRPGTVGKQRVTITFQPEPDVLNLINKVTAREESKATFKYGLRTRIINNAIRMGLALKREAA